MNQHSTMSSNMFQLRTVREILKQSIILYLIFGVGLTLLLRNYLGIHDFKTFVLETIFQGMTWILLWIGNGLISEYLDRKISWLEKTEWRFILGVIAMIVYTISSISILIAIRLMVMNGFTLQRVISVYNPSFFNVALVITVFISMFMHGYAFLKEWRNSASEAERLKNENLKARFETLKSQVNPHFLFNSFNVLSTLVYKDPDKAAKFIQELSGLYRYVLDTQDKETVLIKDEIKALQSFIYLSEMRFGKSLKTAVNLKDVEHKSIAPMVLQMLFENAIKHNIVSKSRPLTIKAYSAHDMIIIENNLQPKNNVPASTGIGLPNIKARYGFLSDQPVTVSETADHFKVEIPAIEQNN